MLRQTTTEDGELSRRVSSVPEHLAWVDEFIEHVRPYLFVRLEDNLLIKRPNNAVKLNATGAGILKSLLDGMPIRVLLARLATTPERLQQVSDFLQAVKMVTDGELDEFSTNPAVQREPFAMSFSEFPVLSEVALTYRCNLKCRFCYAGCNCTTNPVGSDDELSAPQVREVLHRLYHDAKVPSVSFTGGEPILRPELPEMVAYAKDLGMRVNLITNGTLVTRDVAKALSDNGLDSAQVSLEGVCATTHDDVVGVCGAFERACQAVELLRASGIHTHTNTTITRANLDELTAFPAFVKRHLGGERLSMNLMIPTGSGALSEAGLIRYSDIGPVVEAVQAEAVREGVQFMWYSPVPMCMFNSIVHGLGNKGCSACDGLISIAPNGDVLPCASYPESVGNILRQPFHDVWQSARALVFRRKQLAPSPCQRCENFHICNGACPLYWQHVGCAELERWRGEAAAHDAEPKEEDDAAILAER